MSGCKLTASITKETCQYEVAGMRALYLFNYDSANQYVFSDEDKGVIETITLADSAKAYKIGFLEGTASFTDDLAVNGNGGKYRTHTVNFSISNYEYGLLNEFDALSLGKFTAVVVTKRGEVIMLGRTNGLSATAFNYASGAADADANGWTVTLAGTEMEIGRVVVDESVIIEVLDATAEEE